MPTTKTLMQEFWDRVKNYAVLSEEARLALTSIVRKRIIRKNDFFVRVGQVPKTVGFVVKGLFSQSFTADNGDIVIKRFFPENFFVASLSAMLTGTPSMFNIKALENTVILEYDFARFKELLSIHPDIAALYIRYLEVHWIIEKEPLEISYRYDTGVERYAAFLKAYPLLENRLKQHEVASYIGVTPTQLSRIRAKN